MTDYETLAWSRSALDESALSADDGDAALRGLLWRYAKDTRGYMSSTPSIVDEADDDESDRGDRLFFDRHYRARLALVHMDASDDDDEQDDNDDADQVAGPSPWTGQCVGTGQHANVYVVQDARGDDGIDDDDDEEQSAALLALLLARTGGDVEEEEAEHDDDAQRAYADALASALGNVDEVHLHSDGSVALRKDRRLPVLLMGGVSAPAKIADASLTAAQADDGVTVLLGEVALLADEVGAAERALLADQDAGAVVTALHNHWVSDPTLYYLHFQALTRDPATFLSTIAPWWCSL
ncbi:hypothetical protein psal_cds_1156 [Pandoravirus salinus]|uniref:Uncharacterized protein n=1 Tax=Pandoravirus salinus TaxID=1349410 RepID=S4VXN0_9VIRU|nr:hypothetical protein psal_cds_1156 [Pandoravirus salinus]AGO85424.1 hypothetical protein psal_cds_1156 [Pandoravirus salinus]